MNVITISLPLPQPGYNMPGGQILQQCIATTKMGVNNYLFDIDLNYNTLQPESSYEFFHGLHIYKIKKSFYPRSNPYFIKLWAREVAVEIFKLLANLPKFHIIHCHTYYAAIPGLVLKNKLKIPLIITESLSSVLSRTIPSKYESFVSKVYDGSQTIIALSHGLEEILDKYTSNQSRYVVGNVVHPLFLEQDLKAVETVLENRPLKLLSIGVPWHTKGLDLLTEALTILDQNGLDFVLTLGDDDKKLQKVKSLAQKLGISNRIRYTGIMTLQGVQQEMRNADIYVSASRVETFGLTIAEAISNGTPVVATNTAGAKDIVEEHTGLLVEKDPISIANGILKASIDLHKGNFDVLEMQKSIRSRFSQQIIGTKLTDIYKNIIKETL